VSAFRGDLLRKELNIFNFKDLLEYFPLRHIDKTKVDEIGSLNHQKEYAQVSGTLLNKQIVGEKRSRRLIAHLQDQTGVIELVWFQGISWVEKILHVGHQYVAFGRVSFFMNSPQLAHPDLENYNAQNA
jgi:ATP-dependent DNA helicase RecG